MLFDKLSVVVLVTIIRALLHEVRASPTGTKQDQELRNKILSIPALIARSLPADEILWPIANETPLSPGNETLSSSTEETLATQVPEILLSSTEETLSPPAPGTLLSPTEGPLVILTNDPLSSSAEGTLSPFADETLWPIANETLLSPGNKTLSPTTEETLSTALPEILLSSTEDTLWPPTLKTLSSPTEGPLVLPTNNPLSSSAEGTLSPFTDETLWPIANETLLSPGNETLSSSTEETVSAPAPGTLPSPTEGTLVSPADGALSSSDNRTLSSPVDQTVLSPANDGILSSPVNQTVSSPAKRPIKFPTIMYGPINQQLGNDYQAAKPAQASGEPATQGASIIYGSTTSQNNNRYVTIGQAGNVYLMVPAINEPLALSVPGLSMPQNVSTGGLIFDSDNPTEKRMEKFISAFNTFQQSFDRIVRLSSPFLTNNEKTPLLQRSAKDDFARQTKEIEWLSTVASHRIKLLTFYKLLSYTYNELKLKSEVTPKELDDAERVLDHLVRSHKKLGEKSQDLVGYVLLH